MNKTRKNGPRSAGRMAPLRYYLHDGPAALRFQLAGSLNLESASQIDQVWRTASSSLNGRKRIVDITFLSCMDEHGSELLARWHREGTQIVANSEASRALAESIVGEHFGETLPKSTPDSDWTWLPSVARLMVLVAAFVSPVYASAAAKHRLPSQLNVTGHSFVAPEYNLSSQSVKRNPV